MPRTASHLRRPGDAGTYGARSARAEHPEAKAAGAQIFHFQLQIRRGERVVVEPPRLARLLEEVAHGPFDALGLLEVDVIALLHRAYRELARIFALVAAEHVVQQAFAHRAFGDPHVLDVEHAEHFGENRESPGKHGAAILGDRLELELARVAGIDRVLDGAVDSGGRDGERLGIERADRVADRAHRAGAARTGVPAAAAECRLHRLELEARREARALHALGGDLAVAEEALAQGDASHLQAFHVERRQPLADDELGAAPADVHHQALPGLARHGVRDARVDEPRLLHAGDDLDRMPERLAGTLEEGLLAVREAQRVRPHDAHAVGVQVAQPLAGARGSGERARRDFLIDAAVLGYPGREPHHLAQPIDDGQLAVRVTGHHHVKAVGT